MSHGHACQGLLQIYAPTCLASLYSGHASHPMMTTTFKKIKKYLSYYQARESSLIFLKQFIMIVHFDYLAIHFNFSSPDHIKCCLELIEVGFISFSKKTYDTFAMSVDEGEEVAACFWGSGMPWVHVGVMWWQTPSVLCCIHWPFSRKGAVGDLTMNKELFPPVIK